MLLTAFNQIMLLTAFNQFFLDLLHHMFFQWIEEHDDHANYSENSWVNAHDHAYTKQSLLGLFLIGLIAVSRQDPCQTCNAQGVSARIAKQTSPAQ